MNWLCPPMLNRPAWYGSATASPARISGVACTHGLRQRVEHGGQVAVVDRGAERGLLEQRRDRVRVEDRSLEQLHVGADRGVPGQRERVARRREEVAPGVQHGRVGERVEQAADHQRGQQRQHRDGEGVALDERVRMIQPELVPVLRPLPARRVGRRPARRGRLAPGLSCGSGGPAPGARRADPALAAARSCVPAPGAGAGAPPAPVAAAASGTVAAPRRCRPPSAARAPRPARPAAGSR